MLPLASAAAGQPSSSWELNLIPTPSTTPLTRSEAELDAYRTSRGVRSKCEDEFRVRGCWTGMSACLALLPWLGP